MNRTPNIQYAIDVSKSMLTKFTAGDVAKDYRLAAAAVEYLHQYDGTFAFLVTLKRDVSMGITLSPAAAKGVLNCLIFEVQKEGGGYRTKSDPETKQPSPVYGTDEVELVVPDGTYTVVWDDDGKEYKNLRLKRAKNMNGVKPGVQILSVMMGRNQFTKIGFVAGDKFVPWRSFTQDEEIIASIRLLLESEDYEQFGMAYALQCNRCYRCNKELKVPASLFRGKGPVCANLV